MHSSTEEQSIINTVISHCENSTSHQEADMMRIPVTDYTDPKRLEQEIAILFREFPIAIGHCSELAEPGQFLTLELAGVPILATRTRDGEARAFINVCRHRGARLESEPCGKAGTFSCPYHGWTYGLDGALRGLRHASGFGDINKSNFNLVELPAFERFGLIWVRPSPSKAPIDIDAWLAPMAEQFQSLELKDHVIFKKWSVPLKMNWHIALEGFQEQYHFCSAHKHTACSAYLDNQGVYLDQYPHVRHAVPLTGAEKLADLALEDRSYRKNFMTQNFIFPCQFAQVMTDHVYMHTIVPTGTDSCVFHCMMLVPKADSSDPSIADKAQRYWQANYDVVDKVFGEDFAIGEGIQAGLATGANEHFTIGRYEAGLQLARRALDDALAGNLKVPLSKTSG